MKPGAVGYNSHLKARAPKAMEEKKKMMTGTRESDVATSDVSRRTTVPRVGFLVIGRKRRGFDMEWGGRIEAEAWEAVEEWPLTVLRPQTRVVDDTTLRGALQELQDQACDVLVVMQPIMGDGRLAPVLAQLWQRPVVFWATPERQDSGSVSSCSLVGTHVFGSIFRQMRRPFELAYGDPRHAETRDQIVRAAWLCRAVARLQRSKIGLVGSHAPGFINMHPDPVALSRQLGVQLHHFGLQEFYQLVETCDESDLAADLDRVRRLRLPFGEGVSDSDLPANSRYYLAMRLLMDSENLDGLALRCWPELPNRYGQWPYLAMSRLADEDLAVALEGDVDGAATCLLGRFSGLGVGYISDWLEHDAGTITLWHPGHAPTSHCRTGTRRLGKHFNTGHPMVIDAELAADRPITLFRLWRCDGRYQMTALEGHTAAPRRPLSGAHGLVLVDAVDVRTWFESRCHAGMPHHVTLFPGHHADFFSRMARLLDVDWLA
jgi:L-fucose isomerase-like protein